MAQILKKFLLISSIVLGVIIVINIVVFIALLFSPSSDGCYYRYQDDSNPFGKYVSAVVYANGNYSTSHQKSFGQWVRVRTQINEDRIIEVEGEVSLCKGYVTFHNPMQVLASDTQGRNIEIPRVNSDGMGVPLLMTSRSQWKNLMHVHYNDKIQIMLGPNKHDDPSSVMYTNPFTHQTESFNCEEGLTEYNPVCGRYSPYGGTIATKYICEKRGELQCNHCNADFIDSWKRSYGDISASSQRTIMSIDIDRCENCNQEDVKCVYEETDNDHSKVIEPLCEYPCCSKPKTALGKNTICITGQSTRCYKGYMPLFWKGTERQSVLEPYKDDGSNTLKYFDHYNNIDEKHIADTTQYLLVTDRTTIKEDAACTYEQYKGYNDPKKPLTVEISPPQHTKVWFTADQATGLLYRFTTNIEPQKDLGPMLNGDEGNKETLGYTFAAKDSSFNQLDNKYLMLQISDASKVYDESKDTKGGQFLQMRFYSPQNAAGGTGGYVLYLKQTKCVRRAGEVFSDSFEDRGEILYHISDADPNYSKEEVWYRKAQLIDEGNSKYTKRYIINKSDESGYLWIKIRNKPSDYKHSAGSYTVKVYDPEEIRTDTQDKKIKGNFIDSLISSIIEQYIDVGKLMFQKMTCYKASPDTQCINLFFYIKILTILYVMFYGIGLMFGIMQINQYDILIRVTKVAVVGSLMNDNAFDFFANDVLNTLFQFMINCMEAIHGYGIDRDDPFIRLLNGPTSILLETVFSDSFWMRFLTVFSFGIFGIIFILCIGVSTFVVSRAVCYYLVSILISIVYMSILIGLAPIFLTFILFEKTKYLFNYWITILARVTLEPLVLGVGVSVLTQLLIVYMDDIMRYSVCWKCVLPFALPVVGLNLFCINWLAPWGYSPSELWQLSDKLAELFGLLIISYCLYVYLPLASQIAGKILGGSGYSTDLSNTTQQIARKAFDITKGGASITAKFGGNTLRYGVSPQYRARVNSNIKNSVKSGYTSAKKQANKFAQQTRALAGIVTMRSPKETGKALMRGGYKALKTGAKIARFIYKNSK